MLTLFKFKASLVLYEHSSHEILASQVQLNYSDIGSAVVRGYKQKLEYFKIQFVPHRKHITSP
jgi:hypothetical protein